MLARSVLCGAGATQVADPEAAATPSAANHPGAGRPKYQIELRVCERCGRGSQRAGADSVEIERATLDAARCDASIRNDAPASDAHVDAVEEPAPPIAPARPRATVAPAVRRRVLQRDQHRCQVPGCRHTLDLDVHHIVPRADGGTHDPRYLITLCGAHHRAVHAGRLLLSGTAQALCVLHADGSPYGAELSSAAASSADIGEKVFGGLCGLGFKETEAKRALARAFAEHAHGNPGDAEPLTAKVLLKRALALLGTRPRRA